MQSMKRRVLVFHSKFSLKINKDVWLRLTVILIKYVFSLIIICTIVI